MANLHDIAMTAGTPYGCSVEEKRVNKSGPRHETGTGSSGTRILDAGRKLLARLPLSEGVKTQLKTAVRSRFGQHFGVEQPSPAAPSTPLPIGCKDDGLTATTGEALDFVCNVCGTRMTRCPVEKIDREVASCRGCGSSVRMRSIVHLLSIALHGRSIPLPDWPVNKSIRGVGLSDWDGYASRLPAKVDYINTYFHTEPYLDICSPPDSYTGAFDFLISTEVYEHVPPPASRAFEATWKILKPGGAFVFTVPFTNEAETKEHFPDLNLYEIVKIDDDYVMVNRRKNGEYELHKNLIFHGGPGTTLEMRVYCRKDLIRLLENAGFVDIQVMEEPCPEVGIIHKHPWSLPILARKPA